MWGPALVKLLRSVGRQERLVQDLLLLHRVDLARSRRGSGHRTTRDALDTGQGLRQKVRQSQPEERPRTLVCGLFLDPTELIRIRVTVQGLLEATLRHGVELLHAHDGDVVTLVLVLLRQEFPVQLAADQQNPLDRFACAFAALVCRLLEDRTELARREVLDVAAAALLRSIDLGVKTTSGRRMPSR